MQISTKKQARAHVKWLWQHSTIKVYQKATNLLFTWTSFIRFQTTSSKWLVLCYKLEGQIFLIILHQNKLGRKMRKFKRMLENTSKRSSKNAETKVMASLVSMKPNEQHIPNIFSWTKSYIPNAVSLRERHQFFILVKTSFKILNENCHFIRRIVCKRQFTCYLDSFFFLKT